MSSSPNHRPVAVPAEGPPPARAWTGRTRGGHSGNWLIVQCIRRLGVWPAYVGLAFLAAWFTLVGGVADASAAFLGDTVRLPVGAWRRAAASDAPVFRVFAVRESIGRYRFFTFPPELVTGGQLRSSPGALEACVQRYAERRQPVVRRYPFQWGDSFACGNETSSPGATPGPAANSLSVQPAHFP